MAGRSFRVHGGLVNTDRIMNQTFWVGVYPGLGSAELDFVSETLHAALKTR